MDLESLHDPEQGTEGTDYTLSTVDTRLEY